MSKQFLTQKEAYAKIGQLNRGGGDSVLKNG